MFYQYKFFNNYKLSNIKIKHTSKLSKIIYLIKYSYFWLSRMNI